MTVDPTLPVDTSATPDRLDRVARTLQGRLRAVAEAPAARPAWAALSGERWLGHPLHPAIVVAPAGAWTVAAWCDARSAFFGHAEADALADAALRFGVVTAIPAAVTGVVQFVRATGPARRVALLHWALNATSVALYTVSDRLRRRGARRAARRVGAVAFGLVGTGASLGGDLAYRYGVGRTA